MKILLPLLLTIPALASSPTATPVPDNTPVSKVKKIRKPNPQPINPSWWPSEHGAYLAWKREKGWSK